MCHHVPYIICTSPIKVKLGWACSAIFLVNTKIVKISSFGPTVVTRDVRQCLALDRKYSKSCKIWGMRLQQHKIRFVVLVWDLNNLIWTKLLWTYCMNAERTSKKQAPKVILNLSKETWWCLSDKTHSSGFVQLSWNVFLSSCRRDQVPSRQFMVSKKVVLSFCSLLTIKN